MKLRRPLHRKTQRILPGAMSGDEHVDTIVFGSNTVMTMAIHGTPPHTRPAQAAAL
ncbi:conserved protein of unknown function (plasmid) [Cupriavidus neocaledonicus]|uniref:Uncharacterized protein n=1 Tax=Cupriavidus neocaledonicus TaxID=1040979 RepID=A0A375HU96_9BURK|nr:hypothetical protein CBM2605_B40002 [Cupriavidus neocaledonicus]SPD61003.1 conserved protein of unknown function [Cupriavidus neocaledonicus]